MAKAYTNPVATKDKAYCDERLWAFLQGVLDPAEALLVSVHCCLSPEGKKRLHTLASCAAVGLEKIQPEKMRCTAQKFFEEKCNGAAPEKSAYSENHKCGEVPKPLHELIGHSYDDISWESLFPGIRQKHLNIPNSKAAVSLFLMEKGMQFPEHAHLADEKILVLKGSFSESGEVYKTGDLNINLADENKFHAPFAIEDCICLVVLYGPLQLGGAAPGLFDPFVQPE